MSQTAKRFTVFLMAAALLLAAAACGRSDDSAELYVGNVSSAAPSAPSDFKDYSPEVPAAEPGWSFAGEESYDVPSTPAQSAAPSLPSNLSPESKMIYRAYLELESTAFDQAAAGLVRLTDEAGGYFESSQVYNYDANRRNAHYTVRIPADRYRDFCASLGQLAQVNSQQHTAENISETYYDTQSRLETQKTKLARLQELLAKADNMSDIITIESAISDTQWQIDNLSGDLRHYDSLVDYATVDISLQEVAALSPQDVQDVSFFTRLGKAFRQGTRRFGEQLQSLALSIAYGWIGWTLVLVIAAVVIVLLLRRRSKRKAALPAAFQKEPEQTPPDAKDKK